MPEMTPEELAREQLGNLMLHAIKHKKENVQAIIDHMSAAEKSVENLPKFIEAVEQGKTNNEQLGQMVRTLTKTCIQQAKAIKQLSTLMMIMVGSKEFDAMATDVAIRMGKGNEAIREFARSKFGDLGAKWASDL